MAYPTDEQIELLDEGISVPNISDDSDEIGVDAETDQVFDENLKSEIDQRSTIVIEPEERLIYDDEDKDSDESGLGDRNSSELTLDRKLSSSSSSSLESNNSRGRGRGRGRLSKNAVDIDNEELPPGGIRDELPSLESNNACGRGRLSKKAVGINNQVLPPGVIYDVKPEPGFYDEPKNVARLPLSYYLKRESPEKVNVRRAPRVLSPLINFEIAPFNKIICIVDKDDSEKKGYEHALTLLEKILPDLKSTLSKPYYDIWSFGLYAYPLILPKKISCNLLNLFPEKFDNENNRPFWFMFKKPPVFKDPVLRDTTSKKEPDSTKQPSLLLDRSTYADLSYGALTSMTRFYVHKDYIFRKKTRWSFRFLDELIEIQSNIFQRLDSNNTAQIKRKITPDIIDRAAIFHLWNDGFNVFINMKGNIHELYREWKPRFSENDFNPFVRQGIDNKKVMPLFSTVRLRLRLRDDKAILENIEREKKLPKDNLISAREEALKQIREIFKNLLDFFYRNRIHVCFGSISSRNISLDQLETLDHQRFDTFIQSYSWAMLRNISFRLQVQLFSAKSFLSDLREYSNLLDYEKNPEETDDRFYRLCLYLRRRSSEYFFLDLVQEMKYKIKEYERSRKRSFKLTKFNEAPASTTAYIPSVVLTPTTISIRPLKLCKLNRVLREKLFGGCLNFALVELRDEAGRLLFPSEYRALKNQICNYLTNGFHITQEQLYKYLHHSQSQIKSKQFWFYYHDKENNRLSHDDAYAWMGNFDKERVVAKHTARIALCFTSTQETIQIPAETVTYDRDIKDVTKKYAFTDGVGTISSQLRDQIQNFLRLPRSFSVLQIRYGGCKGTLSVDPSLDGQKYQMRIRDSMNKFTTDHDILEVCKLSAPRALYLNRQDIVLLESRDIPHTNFLRLQNKDHLWLIDSLLKSSVAYELLEEKLLPVFKLRHIALNINIFEEQFFIKLIITCAFNIIRELLDRARVRISNRTARNMFGIVDEYAKLKYGEVFIQYSPMRDNKLYVAKKDDSLDEDVEDFRSKYSDKCEILIGPVVITKNPCHHPGDLRIFQAVDYKELRHLKDVVVFPQQGHRPHPNEISGSDLDGDEYVIIWHENLIPETPNETPYEYDSQEDPPKMDRPITREDITKVVMEVSEQDCLGSLSNIHLAYADREKDGIKSEVCTKLAGAISQEVDAAKTGKHPLTEKEIAVLRKGLYNQWPDFMKARGKKEYYPSERVLGKLYRSARRAELGWSRAIKNHGNPRYLQLAAGTDIKDEEENDEKSYKINGSVLFEQPLDLQINHPDYKKYLPNIKELYSIYQEELLEIISLYRFQDEIDLLCRSDSMDASGGGGNKGSYEDSAAIEVQNLAQRIQQDFYSEFNQRRDKLKCCRYERKPGSDRKIWIDCSICHEDKLAKAACAYIYSYQENNRLPLKSNRRILSFPWYFSEYLTQLKARNRPPDYIDQSNTIVGHALSLYLENLTPKFKVYIPDNSADIEQVQLYYNKVEEKRTSLLRSNKKADDTISFVPLLRACFVEILNDWLIKQGVFGEICIETDLKPLIPESIWHELLVEFLSYEYQPNVRLIFASSSHKTVIDRYRQAIDNYRRKWTNKEYEELREMFEVVHMIAEKHAIRTKFTIWTYLDEYILLALQCIGIEKRLIDQWIQSDSSS